MERTGKERQLSAGIHLITQIKARPSPDMQIQARLKDCHLSHPGQQ